MGLNWFVLVDLTFEKKEDIKKWIFCVKISLGVQAYHNVLISITKNYFGFILG